MVVHTAIPAFRRLKKIGHEFKASLEYIRIYRPDWVK